MSRRSQDPPSTHGMALGLVLGLIVLLGVLVGLVFHVTLQNERMVAKGWREYQERLLGISGLSWALARLGSDPGLEGDPVAEVWLEPGGTGFRVAVRPHGLFLGVKVRSLGMPAEFFSWAEVGRVVRDANLPGLLQRGVGEYRVLEGGSFSGGYSLPQGLLVGDGMSWPMVKGTRLDSMEIATTLWHATGHDAARAWSRVANQSLETEIDLDSSWKQHRAVGSTVLSGRLEDRSEWHVKGKLRMSNVECRMCIILAEDIQIEGRSRLEGSVVWSSGKIRLEGRLEGNGQILATDTLRIARLEGVGPHAIYASLGSEEFSRDSLTRSFVEIRDSRCSGWVYVPALGTGLHDLRTRMRVDSTTQWHGGWSVDGAIENAGSLKGTLITDKARWSAPDGVAWDGRTKGHITGNADSVRWCLPWSIHDSARDVGMHRWSHERE